MRDCVSSGDETKGGIMTSLSFLTPTKKSANLKATVPFVTAIAYLEPVNSFIRFSNSVTYLPELLTHAESIQSFKYWLTLDPLKKGS